MPEGLIRELESPPKSPAQCIFARTTKIISADLKTAISPCQFGGNPDCEQCGCIASMALAAVGHHPVLGPITAGHFFEISDRLGTQWKRFTQPRFAPGVGPAPGTATSSPFNVLKP
jgi:hypothetical protein